MLDDVLLDLQKGARKAAAKLLELTQCGHSPTEARAALAFLDQLVKVGTALEVVTELRKLKALIEQQKLGQPLPGPEPEE